jgi:hypothetical protein
MPIVIMAFPLKRSMIARLSGISDGTIPPPTPSAAALVGVQVGTVLPADTDRLIVYGTPVRSTRRQTTAENVTSVESVTVEIRIRVYQPGEQDEDVGDVDQLTGQLVQAVASGLMDGHPIVLPGLGNLNLAGITQWPTAITPYPEPSATGLASLFFVADLVTT